MTKSFCFSTNFLELNIYMRDLRTLEYEQMEAYTLVELLSKLIYYYLC